MAFVNEKYPETEKRRVASLVERRPPFSNPQMSSRWTIDRERDAILVLVGSEGGGYEGTQKTKHYMLIWKGEEVRISADPLGVSNVGDGVVMSWRIRKFEIPDALKNKEGEIISLIKQAFGTLGDVYDGEKYTAVNVNFDNFSR